MAKKAGDIVRSKDRYKQVRVVREEDAPSSTVKEWKPMAKPDLNVGDHCSCIRTPLHYQIKTPIVILDMKPDRMYAFDWGVLVDTSVGPKWLGASLFSKLKTRA